MPVKTSVNEGLYQRVENLVGLAMELPYGLSDEEVEGLVKLLPTGSGWWIPEPPRRTAAR